MKAEWSAGFRPGASQTVGTAQSWSSALRGAPAVTFAPPLLSMD